MGPAYKNIGAQGTITLNCQPTSTTLNSAGSLVNVFTPGDEVILNPTNTTVPPIVAIAPQHAWVLDVDKTPGSEKVSFITRYGGPAIITQASLAGDYVFTFKIIRSGRRNQQALPVASFVTKKAPYVGSQLSFNVNRDIINASATEYSDEWQMFSPQYSGTNDDYSFCSRSSMLGLINVLNYVIQNNNTFLTGTSNTILPENSGIQDIVILDIYSTAEPQYSISSEISGEKIRLKIFPAAHCASAAPLPLPGVLRPVNVDHPFTVDNNYFASILYFTGGAYLTAAQQSALSGTEYYPLTAHTADGKCHSFTFIIDTYPHCYKDMGDLTCNEQQVTTCNGEIDACVPPESATVSAKRRINPYQTGVRGSWRPLRSYAYNSARTYTGNYLSGSTETNIRYDGAFKDFSPFWSPNSGNDWLKPSNIAATKWVSTQEVTKTSPYGYDVENKDALNRYSAAVYGYANSLPTITGANSAYYELAFDGFEDYDFYQVLPNQQACPPKDHFSYKDVVANGDVVNNIAHTGNRALKIEAGDNFTAIRTIHETSPTPVSNAGFINMYNIQETDTLPLFSPQKGKYVFSAWVKSAGANLEDVEVDISFYNDATSTVITSHVIETNTNQPVIEGWKRVEAIIDMPDVSALTDCSIRVKLNNKSTSGGIAYFDDIRMHPFDANVKSYVYDPIRLRLLAQLDENNYATFYEYDEQGNLVRVKRETERGVMTIQENRQNIKKQ